MLRLLLDEHVAPDVAEGLRRRANRLVAHAVATWEGGSYLGQEDAVCLGAAFDRRLTLVTCDRRTIPPLLKRWAEEGRSHGGVLFIDEKTIAPSDIGGLVRALESLAAATGAWDWTDRVVFLRR